MAKGYALSAAVVFLLAAGSASGDSIRCDARYVHTGETQQRTRSICGEPDHADRRYERHSRARTVRGPCPEDSRRTCEITERYTEEIVVDEWTYDFGPRRLLHHLTFRNGRLSSIRTEGYGSDDE
jgi:hypothetical protein